MLFVRTETGVDGDRLGTGTGPVMIRCMCCNCLVLRGRFGCHLYGRTCRYRSGGMIDSERDIQNMGYCYTNMHARDT